MNPQRRLLNEDSTSGGGGMATSGNPAKSWAPSQEAIRVRAYLKWRAAGKPTGHDLFFWVQAERELYRDA